MHHTFVAPGVHLITTSRMEIACFHTLYIPCLYLQLYTYTYTVFVVFMGVCVCFALTCVHLPLVKLEREVTMTSNKPQILAALW